MATEILDKLISSQWGKSLIMWFFLAMCAAIAALGWYAIRQANELAKCNEYRMEDNRQNNLEKAALAKERIADLQQIIIRLEAVEKKRRK